MNYLLLISGIILIWAIIIAWVQQRKTMTVQPYKTWVHLLAWYLPYVCFPLLGYVICGMVMGELTYVKGGLWAVLIVIVMYARFIEPHRLVVQYHEKTGFITTSQPIKIALIADLHIGLFSGHQAQLKRIVDQLNHLQTDMVIIAGDWTYESYHTLAEQIAYFKQVKSPIYAVLGNHDEGVPGPPMTDLLHRLLLDNHIHIIENKCLEFEQFYLIGIGDLWAGKADMHHLTEYPQDKPFLIISHNPDTADLVPKLDCPALMLSGHTHGGQVKLPYITDYYLSKVSHCGHNRGWYTHLNSELFVTVGTGMVGVPFRFRTPPTIDVLIFKS